MRKTYRRYFPSRYRRTTVKKPDKMAIARDTGHPYVSEQSVLAIYICSFCTRGKEKEKTRTIRSLRSWPHSNLSSGINRIYTSDANTNNQAAGFRVTRQSDTHEFISVVTTYGCSSSNLHVREPGQNQRRGRARGIYQKIGSISGRNRRRRRTSGPNNHDNWPDETNCGYRQ